jgi:hypothetical protein
MHLGSISIYKHAISLKTWNLRVVKSVYIHKIVLKNNVYCPTYHHIYHVIYCPIYNLYITWNSTHIMSTYYPFMSIYYPHVLYIMAGTCFKIQEDSTKKNCKYVISSQENSFGICVQLLLWITRRYDLTRFISKGSWNAWELRR